MIFFCNICNFQFTQKKNLLRHLNEKRCKSVNDIIKLNDYILKKNIKIREQQVIINDQDNIINQLKSKILEYENKKEKSKLIPLNKLSTKDITIEKMKELIEKYTSPDKLNIVLSEYIKNMINHPENNIVKYIKKKPPTYICNIENENVIKGLKDTCELLSEPVLVQLKIKFKEFLKKYKNDDDPEFDYGLYEDAIQQFKNDLNKKNVKKAIRCVLQNDILNNMGLRAHTTQ